MTIFLIKLLVKRIYMLIKKNYFKNNNGIREMNLERAIFFT